MRRYIRLLGISAAVQLVLQLLANLLNQSREPKRFLFVVQSDQPKPISSITDNRTVFHPNGPTFTELAKQALSSTRQGYDLLAPKFDHTPFRTPDIVLKDVLTHLRSIGSVETGLDICCGTGAGVELLREVCKTRVVGADFSQGMLDQAASNLKLDETEKNRNIEPSTNIESNTNNPKIELVRCDVLDLPFENEFDLVVSFGAFGHFLSKEQEIFLDQVTKVLRPGGRFVFVTTYMPGFFSPAHIMSRGFNWSMRIRNLLVRPPFIMYYLTFLLPKVRQQLEARGFSVVEHSPYSGRLKALRLVEATLA